MDPYDWVSGDDPITGGHPLEFVVPELFLHREPWDLCRVPAPVGSLPELLSPLAFARPFGTPLTPAVPACPAFGGSAAVPVPADAWTACSTGLLIARNSFKRPQGTFFEMAGFENCSGRTPGSQRRFQNDGDNEMNKGRPAPGEKRAAVLIGIGTAIFLICSFVLSR
jgi:hypothetical protein